MNRTFSRYIIPDASLKYLSINRDSDILVVNQIIRSQGKQKKRQKINKMKGKNEAAGVNYSNRSLSRVCDAGFSGSDLVSLSYMHEDLSGGDAWARWKSRYVCSFALCFIRTVQIFIWIYGARDALSREFWQIDFSS